MKITINTDNIDIFNTFKNSFLDNEYYNAKSEFILFSLIEKNEMDAYILSGDKSYFKKAVDFIRKKQPNIPIIAIISSNHKHLYDGIDIYMDIPDNSIYSFCQKANFNINSYIKNFNILKKLTSDKKENIEFANYIYDPIRRILYYNNERIKKRFSVKESGILELLSSNYGEVVKKDLILQKVWRKTDYFAGRSMDVYITYLRNTFKDFNISLTIKNIPGMGLMLE